MVTDVADALVVNGTVSWLQVELVVQVLAPPSTPRYTFDPLTQADSVYAVLGRTAIDWVQRAMSFELGLDWSA